MTCVARGSPQPSSSRRERPAITSPIVAVVSILSVTALARLFPVTDAHQHCYFDDRNPVVGFESEVAFCPDEDPDGFCCNFEEETDAQARYEAKNLGGQCASLHKEVVCSICSPFSGHLYEQVTSKGVEGLTMRTEFCEDYVAECTGQIDFPSDYCQEHTVGFIDTYWSYPYEAEADFDSEGMTKAFPGITKAELPDIPFDMEMTPNGTHWWIAGQKGQIYQYVSDDPEDIDEVILDMPVVDDGGSISGLGYSKEEGLLGFALSPDFTGIDSFFYVSYTYVDMTLSGDRDEKGRNRLSKFTYKGDADVTLATEEVLITTDPKATGVHPSGWVGFKPSARLADPAPAEDELFWSVGDGGGQYDPRSRASDLDTLLGKIVRILVPRADTSGSAVKYSNPSGNVQGEICSYGHRNPFRCGFDRTNDKLYCGEVGQIKVEEINIIECGNNYGWNRFEGDLCMQRNQYNFARLGSCADADWDSYVSPFFQYCHASYSSEFDNNLFTNGVDVCGDRTVLGRAVIGGVVYRGNKYKDVLDGKYIFHDYETSGYYFVDENGEAGTILAPPTDGKNRQAIGFIEDNEGEIYLIEYNNNIWRMPCGELCASTCLGEGDPPAYENVGCFADPSESVLDYQTEDCPEGEDAMSPDICASNCISIPGATYFGVQSGSKCFCGETDPSTLTASSECTMLCQSNPLLTCGGNGAIDLYVLPDAIRAPAGSSYLGCFSDNQNDRLMTLASKGTDVTNELCSELCRATTPESAYYATENGNECRCGPESLDYAKYGDTAVCNEDCSGGDGKCGGEWALSIYLYDVVGGTDDDVGGTDDLAGGTDDDPIVTDYEIVDGASYLGCFKDTEVRLMDLSEITNAMTAQVCFDSCVGNTYFSVQFGNECWCGDASTDVDQYGTAICDRMCAGGDGYTCGGRWAMAAYEYTNPVSPPPATAPPTTGPPTKAPAATAPPTATEPPAVTTAPPTVPPAATAPPTTPQPTMVPAGTSPPSPSAPLTSTYLGCFRDRSKARILGDVSLSDDAMTPQMCESHCSQQGTTYWGLQFSNECFCGNNDNYDVHSGRGNFRCSYTCGGSDDTCGGYNAMDIYTFGQSYEALGCYADDRVNRVFTVMISSSEDNDTKKCSEECAGYAFFATQWGRECWCGEAGTDYDVYGPASCTHKCRGNRLETCGGLDALSVYQYVA